MYFFIYHSDNQYSFMGVLDVFLCFFSNRGEIILKGEIIVNCRNLGIDVALNSKSDFWFVS